MKAKGGGGTAKGGGKNRSGGGTVKVETSKARQTAAINDNIVMLRAALFEENGKDKDVTKDIAKSFMKFDRNGLDVSIDFETKLSKEDAKWAFDLCKETMEDKYEESGYGWDDEDKMRELTEKGTRFLVVREWPEQGQTKGEPVGFAHFRFTVQGEVIDQMAGHPSLHIYDIHIEDHSQRKGLGKHLLMIMELIARREKMKVLSLPVQLMDSETREWITHVGRGWAVDESLRELGFDADLEVRTAFPVSCGICAYYLCQLSRLLGQKPPYFYVLRRCSPAVYCCDCSIPRMQGFEVYSKVLADLAKRPAAATPVVAAISAAAPATVFKAPATVTSSSGATVPAVAVVAESSPTVAAPGSAVDVAAVVAPEVGAGNVKEHRGQSEEVEGGWVCL